MTMEINHSPYLKHIFVCINHRDEGKVCCATTGGEAIQKKLKEAVKEHGLQGKVRVSSSGCLDLCAQGPNVLVEPDHKWYHHVTSEDVDRIIEMEFLPLVPFNGAAQDKPIRVFLFDLGNVLVRFDHRRMVQKLASLGKASAEELYELFFDSPLVADHDTGRISTRLFYEELQKRIHLSGSYEQFVELWNGIFTESEGMADMVKNLLARYPCYLISNTNRPHFEFCMKEYPILQQLSGWVLSYEVGLLKPHPGIYRRALELSGVSPSQIFYVDDRADLIQAAGSMGFKTHHFSGIGPLLEDLKNYGVLISENENPHRP